MTENASARQLPARVIREALLYAVRHDVGCAQLRQDPPAVARRAEGLMEQGRGGPTVARLELGAMLRERRIAAGFDGPRAADAIGSSLSKVSRLEGGLRPIKDQDVLELLDLYQVSEAERDAMLALARKSRSPGWWANFPDFQGPRRTALEREAEGSLLRVFDPFAIPAVLQTADYAHALCETHDPQRLQWRGGIGPPILARRREVIKPPGGPAVWALIAESVLRRAPQDNQDILRAQLHALRVSAGKPSIVIQIVPDESVALGLAAGAFTMVRFGGGGVKDVVVIEELTSFDVAVDPSRVDMYRDVWYRLVISALLPDSSREVLEDPEKWFRKRARRPAQRAQRGTIEGGSDRAPRPPSPRPHSPARTPSRGP